MRIAKRATYFASFNYIMSQIVIIFVIVYSCFSNALPPKVLLPQGGSVVGSYMTTVTGKNIAAFRGIPYAEPPVGLLRFEAPRPIGSWDDEKLTNEDASMCIQINPYERNFTVVGSEDCLYLNVYVPQNVTTTLLPVMIYIHGGGWVTGTGNSNLHGPQRLVDHGVILVIGNYRLGALGFLSTGSVEYPGNNGFKDQLLILKWVKDNIQAFGGNNNDVTLFGESAGSVSVAYHMYSKASTGLFHKAIMQSGSIFNSWAIIDSKTAINRAEKLAILMNCTCMESDWKKTVDCLKTIPAEDIVLSLRQFFIFDIDPVIAFAGVIEPEHEGAFLTEHPQDITMAPSVGIPIIVGGTSDEGVIKSGPILNLINDEFTKRFDEVLPIIAGFTHIPEVARKKLIQRIDEFYFKSLHNWSKENHQNLTNFFSDQRFNFGIDKFLRKRFKATENMTHALTFVYLFGHRGPKSASEMFHSGSEYYGVCHTDDLPYIFYNDLSRIEGNENDKLLKSVMPELWANFAKTNDPTPDGSMFPKWIAANGFPLKYVQIGTKIQENWTLLKNHEGLFEERLQFWRNLEEEFNL